MSENETVEDKKGGKGKLIVIALVVVLVGGGAGFFFMKPAPADAEVEAEPEPAVGVEGEIVEVGTMTVNLADEEVARYARVGLALLIPPESDGVAVAGKVSLIRDAALTIIMSYSSDDLLTEKGLEDLRERLTEKAFELYGDAVVSVLLTELTVQ